MGYLDKNKLMIIPNKREEFYRECSRIVNKELSINKYFKVNEIHFNVNKIRELLKEDILYDSLKEKGSKLYLEAYIEKIKRNHKKINDNPSTIKGNEVIYLLDELIDDSSIILDSLINYKSKAIMSNKKNDIAFVLDNNFEGYKSSTAKHEEEFDETIDNIIKYINWIGIKSVRELNEMNLDLDNEIDLIISMFKDEIIKRLEV